MHMLMQDKMKQTEKIYQPKLINHQNLGKQMINYWPDSQYPQWSRQAVITVSRSTWNSEKIKKGVATDLFFKV